MTLSDFKASRGLTLVELAALLRRPVSTVHSWVSGARRPDWDSVADIQQATGGMVTAGDFVPSPKLILAPAGQP